MASFDPSIISQIPSLAPNPLRATENAYKLADIMDENTLRKMQMRQMTTQASEQSAVQNILKKSDLSTPEGRMKAASEATKISPQLGMKLSKDLQDLESGELQNKKAKLEIADQQQGAIVSAIDPVIQQLDAMKSQGATPAMLDATAQKLSLDAITNLIQARPDLKQSMAQFAQNPKNLTYAGLKTAEGQTKQGQVLIKQHLDQFKADIQDRSEKTRERGEDERERSDRAREAVAAQKQQAREFGGPEGGLLGALADRGVSLPAGLRSQAQMKATLTALIDRHPGKTVDEIADGVESGQIRFGAEKKETQIAAGISGKIRYAEEEINRLVPLVKQASTDVPRGQFVPWNKLQQYSEKQLSNPQLKKLKAYMITLSNAYDVLAARGGTDIEKRKHNREMFDTADSPEALQAAMDAVLTEARVSGEAATASTKPRLQSDTAPPAAASPPPQSGKVVDWGSLK